MAELTDLTAAEAARRIRAGTVSPVDLLEACLARVDAVEPRVLAWVACDRAGARHSFHRALAVDPGHADARDNLAALAHG